MRFKFYLDDIEVTEPIGVEGLVTTIKRDRTVNGVLTTQDATLTFIEDGYDYLHNLLTNDTFCSSAAVKILISEDEGQNYSEYFIGTIFISDVRFNEWRKYAKTKIQDNSFDAKINNNKNVQAVPFSARSKNDVAITAAPYVTLTLFDVATGTDITVTGGAGNEAQGRAYRVYDLFAFFVAFMTDGEIEFNSTLFGIGGKYEGLCVTSGYMLKGDDGGTTPEPEFNETFPKLSYQEIFKELKAKLNLCFIMENGSTAPLIRIEDAAYITDSATTIAYIQNIDEIETYVSANDVYSSVRFGSGGLVDAVAYDFPEMINFIGFKDEQYHTLGTCNVDNTLDLSGDWIVSSNAIQEALDTANLSEMADDATVLINCTPIISGSTYAATKTNWLDGSSKRYYNEALTNSSICQNYFTDIPNSIALFLGNDDNTFSAQKPLSDPYYYDNGNNPELLITCTNVLADPSLNYTSPFYTAPATGTFTFSGKVILNLLNSSGTATLYNDFSLVFRRKDSADVFIADTVVPIISTVLTPSSTQQIIVEGGGTLVMNITDRCYLYIKVDGYLISYKVISGSMFKCTATSTGGGVFQTYDPSNYSVLRHDFEFPLTFSQFNAIRNNPKGVIYFYQSDGDVTRKGFVENIKYGVEKSKITLFSSRNLNK